MRHTHTISATAKPCDVLLQCYIKKVGNEAKAFWGNWSGKLIAFKI